MVFHHHSGECDVHQSCGESLSDMGVGDLQHATNLLVNRPDLCFAEVSERRGFSDQAHLSNEVKRMSGLTATALRSHGPGGVFED